MNLRRREQTLAADIKGREKALTTDVSLIAHWRAELAAAKAAAVDHSRPVPRHGVDYAYGSPMPARLVKDGVSFVCRYVGGGTKSLVPSEVEALEAGRLDIVTVYEQGAQAALKGHGQGALDAQAAKAALRSLPHAKTVRPVYFAVDFDPFPASVLTQVVDYVRGATAEMGRDLVGVYGGIETVRACLNAGVCRYAWQTVAWSRGQWDPRAQLRQIQNETGLASSPGLRVDVDEARAADFGQWR